LQNQRRRADAALKVSPASTKIPAHIAIVMDGNGRWAEKRMQPRVFGHRAGVKAVRDCVETAAKLGVQALTLFAFSSENWARPDDEVNALMELFLKSIRTEAEQLHRDGVALRFIGDLSRFTNPLREEMQDIVSLTATNKRLFLNVAVNYGGRWDVVQAAKRISQDVLENYLKPSDISEAVFAPYMSLADLPAIDLFVRTGGEQRISNFLLWQIAYAELYFTPILWPDFDAKALQQAVTEFGNRQRRFGRTGQQIESET
jgi:undecaprenyl diphosphate synthase